MLRRLSSRFKTYEDTHTWGPLLITIGPHCSGKSSFVKSLDEQVKDHVIDDARELYEKVGLSIALSVWQDKVSGEVVQALKGRTVHDISIIERLKSQKGSEQVILTKLFAKLITFKEFEEKISNLLSETDHDELFIACVKEIFNTKGMVLKTKTVDLFIPESVESATIQVSEEMKKDIKTHQGVICWGNSNLNPDFYKDVLRTCSKYQRVVRFVRWGKELPAVSLKELLKRNILQYLNTGRYTESTKIAKFRKYAEFFTTKAGNNTHADYAALAGYSMDAVGRVTEDTPGNRKSTKSRSPGPPSNETRWSVWTNSGLVYNINGVAPQTVVVPPSPKSIDIASEPSPSSSQFASTNISAAKTPAAGDRTKHFFPSVDSDGDMSPTNGKQSADSGKGIAELDFLPEVADTHEKPLIDVNRANSATMPPRSKSSPRADAEHEHHPSSVHSSPQHSRKGSKDFDSKSPQHHDPPAPSSPYRAVSITFGGIMGLFNSQHDETTPEEHHNDDHKNDHNQKEEAHEKLPPVVPFVEVPQPTRKQSSILSLFQSVEEPENVKEESPAAEVDPELVERLQSAQSEAAVFVLDPNPPKHEEMHYIHRETHHNHDSNMHISEDEGDEDEDDIGFETKPEPLHHDHHKVFIQDSVKLTHQKAHTHVDKEIDVVSPPPRQNSENKKISFKDYVVEIPVSVNSDNALRHSPKPSTAEHSNETNDEIAEEFAPAETPRGAQDKNPFACILPSIFCSLS